MSPAATRAAKIEGQPRAMGGFQNTDGTRDLALFEVTDDVMLANTPNLAYNEDKLS